MTRGNQRDLAREKAAKKDKGKSKAANEQAANAGMTKEQRMARYSDKLGGFMLWLMIDDCMIMILQRRGDHETETTEEGRGRSSWREWGQ